MSADLFKIKILIHLHKSLNRKNTMKSRLLNIKKNQPSQNPQTFFILIVQLFSLFFFSQYNKAKDGGGLIKNY